MPLSSGFTGDTTVAIYPPNVLIWLSSFPSSPLRSGRWTAILAVSVSVQPVIQPEDLRASGESTGAAVDKGVALLGQVLRTSVA